ncbi:MAG: hypothetical protein K8M05_22015 [Deltaproteobacteria bacterium]|nr:hypothetical protein [Kofleriaceae bacterium]
MSNTPFTSTISVLPPDVDPAAAIAAIHADCPECQAALARGEKPIVMSGAEIMAALTRPQRRRIERELAKAERRAARASGQVSRGRR